jgi:RHH-type proline utilization regulon transcriptional repressor/proline dehydrogenase/delta 1-pyrroline-5-carboxylate dehydrogenase
VNRDLSPPELDGLDAAAREAGRSIFERLGRRQLSIFERRFWDDRLMEWAMRDPWVKVQLFRFVDVLPMLATSEQLVEHLRQYMDEVRDRLPWLARAGLALARPGSMFGELAAGLARKGAMGNARRFIAGRDAEQVIRAAKAERDRGRAFTLDLLGEAVTSEAEADRYLSAYLELLAGIAPAVNAWPENPRLDRAGDLELPRANVSIKLSALDSQFDAIDPEGTLARVAPRLRTLLREARRHRAFVNVDMESYKTKDLTLAIFKSVLGEDEFRRTADVGIVIQCYLRDAEQDLAGLIDWSRSRGTPVWVRLVKGAYWDYETVHARAKGWPVPVFERKWESDDCFERLTCLLLRHADLLRPALASHNVRSLAYGIAAARRLGLTRGELELQMLYGMADDVKQVLVESGHRLRVYMPFGELIPGMAYLVRRLLENTADDSFLRASFHDHVSTESLLMSPRQIGDTSPPAARAAAADVPTPAARSRASFTNEAPTDFSQKPQRDAMREALARVGAQFGRHYPPIIAGRQVEGAARFEVMCPSHKKTRVGTVGQATVEEAIRAVGEARRAWPSWAATAVEARADFLRRAAEVMRGRKFDLAAWAVHECGKPWREAEGDVAEAIDFCEYYAAGALEMAAPHGLDVPGEENSFDYLPRGVAVVIAPWNFPLAILTGMTVAALVTGNTVVMKPAEQSSIVAWTLMDVFREIGLPAGVVQYVPGPGETVGAALVEHPDTAVIAFTGSRQVGLAINARAAEVSARGAPMVKRVIAEMGGKNAIIVDDDADLDEAVLGVLTSAFGFQGQKCSACSRAIVLSAVHDAFLERLVQAAKSLKVGPAEDPGTTVGPVIDAEALARIHRYIEWGKKECRAVLSVDVGPLESEGYFVGPHIFADVPPDSRLALDEIFGPVLAVLRADNLDHAYWIANGTEYALTGGIFSRSPANLARARRELAVGNLYINRGITGALVARQPFGGFRMSGIGSKAGGPDYLLQFVVPRTVTENTLRRGFAPPSD